MARLTWDSSTIFFCKNNASVDSNVTKLNISYEHYFKTFRFELALIGNVKSRDIANCTMHYWKKSRIKCVFIAEELR